MRRCDLGAAAGLGFGIVVAAGDRGGPIGLDQLAQHYYVKGEQLRGTRKLSPREYEKEHYHDFGYGLTVYEMESTKK